MDGSSWMERLFLGALAIGVAGWLAAPHRRVTLTPVAAASASTPSLPRAPRPLVRGNAFPDGVIALTWDDGPDTQTLALARYLHEQRVSGTFFVVGEWVDGLSMEPGIGENPYRTGYAHIPVLADLIGLGHRLGSHTRNHVVLQDDALPIETATEQLAESQRATDPFLTNELRLFRAPGGAWGERASRAAADPFLADVIGPVHWDVDRHDWDGSLYCRDSAADDCEDGPVGKRVRADAMARRYLAAIESTRRGVVLLHDRVGHVGSRWALALAQALVPALDSRGYVFAAPVLAFSPLRERGSSWGPAENVAMADIDGDGRADACRLEGHAIRCARASIETGGPSDIPRVRFEPERLFVWLPGDGGSFAIADVRGRGAADLCVLGAGSIDCLRGPAGPLERWLSFPPSSAHSLVLGDIDGDGRADACLAVVRGVVCATSNAASFGDSKPWSVEPIEHDIALADVDGDRRADLCRRSAGRVRCALSNGHAFAREQPWSTEADFDARAPLRFADLNGDGRADVCMATPNGVHCALSDGRQFKRASRWSPATSAFALADVSGDRRADLCTFDDERIACGLAP